MDKASLAGRYHVPEPRLVLGTALAGLATSAIDVSDGLIADAGHLARAAGLRTAWLNRNGHEWPGGLEPPDRTIADLRELDELLAAPTHPE